jgi:hypothetical protein
MTFLYSMKREPRAENRERVIDAWMEHGIWNIEHGTWSIAMHCGY